jgi:hypothetical protein
MTLATDLSFGDFSFDGAELNASLLALDAVAHESVQMKLLAWVMGLPNGLDPAVAARMVMKQHDARISAPLMKLIEVVAQYPRERLAQMVRRRKTLN